MWWTIISYSSNKQAVHIPLYTQDKTLAERYNEYIHRGSYHTFGRVIGVELHTTERWDQDLADKLRIYGTYEE